MPFYDDMAAMAADLLRPDTAGGLGQGQITIVRLTPGTPDPDAPWVPVAQTRTEWTVDQVSTVKAEFTQGGTVIKTDLAYMTTPPAVPTRPGDIVERDGQRVGVVVHVAPYPAHGVPVYQRLFLNR